MSQFQDDNSHFRESQAVNSLNEGFSVRLVAQMGNLRLSQADLMRIADITKSSVSAYCNGNRLPPSDATIRISKALDVRPEWLILGTGPKEDSKVVSPHVAESDSDQGIWRGGLKPASPP
ncbi:MAG: helix-turn-helix transcriptional regulator, partial [Patescibacteria group bacterium]